MRCKRKILKPKNPIYFEIAKDRVREGGRTGGDEIDEAEQLRFE